MAQFFSPGLRALIQQDPDQSLQLNTVHAYPLSSQNSLITVNAYFAKDTSDRQKTLIDFDQVERTSEK